MGLFKKKSAAEDGAVQEQQTSPKKPKKNELMRIFNESVWESVAEDLKANTQFHFKVGDVDKYVALLFDTNDVGGFTGKDAKRDESKGSVIEAIKSGRIKTYIRPEMLEDGVFVIIPDMNTVDIMDEFAMFNDIEYTLCTIMLDSGFVATETEHGTNEDDDPEVRVKLSDIEELIKTGGDVKELIPYLSSAGDTGMPTAFGVAAATSSDDEGEFVDDDLADEPLDEDIEDDPYEDVDSFDPDIDEFDPDIDETDTAAPVSSFDDEPDIDDFGADVPDSSSFDSSSVSSAPVASGSDDAGYSAESDEADYGNESDEADYDEYDDLTEAVVEDYVTRQFYSDDLGLEISTQPFDMQFLHGNAYVPFNEDRGSGWLNEYLSNLAKDANVRMERMHNENLFRMRERYMRIIQQQCHVIASTLDVSDDTTQYGKIRYAIEQNRAENENQIEESIAEKKRLLEESWQQKLNEVGELAAREARSNYMDRHRAAHENDLLNLEAMEKNEILRDYNNSIKRMNDDRKAEASKLLDLAVSETLQSMADLYLKVLRDEQREYVRLQNEMTRFIDDNRKDEKARIEALAEENRQIKKADEVRKEFTAKLRSMSAEFDVRKTSLQADIDRMQKEHELEIQKYESEWAKRVQSEKEKNTALQKQLDELMNKYADLDRAKKEEYESRINTYEQEREAMRSELDHVSTVHNKSSKVTVFLIVAILVAAIGIGFIFGTILNVRNTSKIEQSELYQKSIEQMQEERNNTPASNSDTPADENTGNSEDK